MIFSSRVIRYLVACYIPICKDTISQRVKDCAQWLIVYTGYKGIVGIIQWGEVGHFDWTSIWIFALGEELINWIQGVGLDGVICGEHDELGNVRLRCVSAFFSGRQSPCPRDRRFDMERRLTGWSPPGGLTLAQLQFGNWHFEGSHEYEYAKVCGLAVVPIIPLSWASTKTDDKATEIKAEERIATYTVER